MLFSFLAEQCSKVLPACVAGGLSRDGTTAKTKQRDSNRILVRGSEAASSRRSLCSSRIK